MKKGRRASLLRRYRGVWQAIWDFQQYSEGVAPTVREVASAAYCAPATVSRAIEVLELFGVVRTFRTKDGRLLARGVIARLQPDDEAMRAAVEGRFNGGQPGTN